MLRRIRSTLQTNLRSQPGLLHRRYHGRHREEMPGDRTRLTEEFLRTEDPLADMPRDQQRAARRQYAPGLDERPQQVSAIEVHNGIEGGEAAEGLVGRVQMQEIADKKWDVGMTGTRLVNHCWRQINPHNIQPAIAEKPRDLTWARTQIGYRP